MSGESLLGESQLRHFGTRAKKFSKSFKVSPQRVSYSVPAEPGLINRASVCCSRAALAAVSLMGGVMVSQGVKAEPRWSVFCGITHACVRAKLLWQRLGEC